jgi:hypothetical protein
MCGLVEIQLRFGVTYCLHLQVRRVSQANSQEEAGREQKSVLLATFLVGFFLDPEDGGSMFLRNVSELLPNYTASHPFRTVAGCLLSLTAPTARDAPLCRQLLVRSRGESHISPFI